MNNSFYKGWEIATSNASLFATEMQKVIEPSKEIVLQNTIEGISVFIAELRKLIEPTAKIVLPQIIKEVQSAIKPIAKRVNEIEQQYGSISAYLDIIIDERHQALEGFGWFYAFGVPDHIADEIYYRKNSINQNEVDDIVTSYFKEEDYTPLLTIISNWRDSPHFSSRQHIFEEAMETHSRGLFYSSITLLSVHTEGVIKDYVRVKLSSESDLRKCVDAIKKTLYKNSTASFSELDTKILFGFLNAVFLSDFWHKNPDLRHPKGNGITEQSHNLSRKKNAHGQVIRDVTEADSIKCFLYLHGLFHLFIELDRSVDGDE